MIHASLFSGIGGPEVAAAMMGWENAFHCEINPFGRAVLEYWFPNSKSYEDITKTDFREWRGKIDILTGGFPCQPFSYAGKRGGREDERYLWPEMLRVIDEVRPAWVVGENVAGITTMVEGGVLTPMGRDTTLFGEGDGLYRYELRQSFTIERICRDLEGLGYSVQPVLIPAAAVGAPHRRDRVFICAHRDSDGGYPLGEVAEISGKEQGSNPGRVRQDGGYADVTHPDEHGGTPQGADSAGDRPGADILPGKAGQGKGHSSVGADGLSTVQGAAQDSLGDGRRLGADDQQREAGVIRDAGSGDDERICGEEGVPASHSHGWRGGEVSSEIHSGVADGDESVSDGGERNVTDADGRGREKPQQPGREKNREEEGAGMDNPTERSGGNGNAADAFRTGFPAALQPGLYGEKERDGERRHAFLTSDDAWLEGTWWDNFPTVSPVHRGNDGIPFPVDCLTVPPIPKPPTSGKGDPKQYPFGKWRTESLKAYGNAIVPQVMYRIFQAIKSVEDKAVPE